MSYPTAGAEEPPWRHWPATSSANAQVAYR